MSQWLVWIVLSALTGSPVLAAVLLLAFWWGVDRVTFRFLPSPVRLFRRWSRVGRLRRELQNNPHDRRARLELAELLIGQGRHSAALEAVRPNVEAGDDDASTLFVMGVACLGAKHSDQGEVFLNATAEADPTFRLGGVDLERGRWRLRRGDFKGAREALQRFVHTRKGTVEGRVLLARALEGGGDDGSAALMRQEAWSEFVSAPRFQRNVERFWAWRAKPSRPLLYAALAVVVVVFFARVVAPSLGSLRPARHSNDSSRPGEEANSFGD